MVNEQVQKLVDEERRALVEAQEKKARLYAIMQ